MQVVLSSIVLLYTSLDFSTLHIIIITDLPVLPSLLLLFRSLDYVIIVMSLLSF